MAFAVANHGLKGQPAEYSIPRIGVGMDVTTLDLFKKRIKF